MLLPTNFALSPRGQLLRFVLIIFGLGCLVLGFLQSSDTGESHTLYVIDSSLSMAVEDISGSTGQMMSRLDLARSLILSGVTDTGGRYALMTAAAGGKLVVPMTDEWGVFSDIVSGISIDQDGGGSSLSTPLETIRLLYGSIPHLQIIWITDGEFSDSGSTLSGWTIPPDITFVGVGTRTGGPILLGYDSDGRPRYKESVGKRVISIRDDVTLRGVVNLLDAELIFREREIASPIAKTPKSNIILPYLTIIGVLSMVIGLMISRFAYIPQLTPHGK